MTKENQEKQILPPDEIDLMVVFVRFVNFFKSNSRYFLFFNVIGITLGTAYLFLKSPEYESKMVAECQSIQDLRAVDLIKDLENLRLVQDWPLLAKKLNISVEEAKKIKKLNPLTNLDIERETKEVDDYLLPTLQNSNVFGLTVRVKDNKILPKLQEGIVFYLGSNEFSKTKTTKFQENRKNIKNFINKEIKKLDSVNTAFADKVVSGNSGITAFSSPGDYKTIVIDLMGRILEIEDQIYFARPVTVIQPFTPFKEPVTPDPISSYSLSILFTNAFCLLMIIFLALRNAYKENSYRA